VVSAVSLVLLSWLYLTHPLEPVPGDGSKPRKGIVHLMIEKKMKMMTMIGKLLVLLPPELLHVFAAVVVAVVVAVAVAVAVAVVVELVGRER